MKYIVLVGDGMADRPVEELGGKTPLQVARIPNMKKLAEHGQVGSARFIPRRMAPGSDVANLSILGYDPAKYYTGRAPLEAANLGIELKEGEVAFRCNLVTVGDNTMIDYSAGHIETKEAKVLIELLNQKLGQPGLTFYPGVSYRHILVISDTKLAEEALRAECVPPHDITGRDMMKYLPRGKGAQVLKDLMEQSREILSGHDINHVRIDLKENPANYIWLWGQGEAAQLPAFKERYGLSGAIISAVDLLKGIGKLIGMDVILVPGATGYYDTDYAAKAKYALKALQKKDFVFVHVEAPDEAGHNGDLRAKISAIENFDKLVVGGIWEKLKEKKNCRILVLSDHVTPLSIRTHASDPVPFVWWGEGIEPDEALEFNEPVAAESQLKFNHGFEVMKKFLTQ